MGRDTDLLAGKVALVTGAGSGLGRGIAERMGQVGAAVACCDVAWDRAAEVADAIRAAGADAMGLSCDVTREDDTTAAVEAAIGDLGGLDVVVANAGVPGEGAVHDLQLSSWERVISVHLTGTFLTVRAALPHLLAQGSGTLVLQASIAGLVGMPNIAAYSAAKGGIIALTRQLACEYAGSGVRANAIAPGPVTTPLVEQAFRERHGVESETVLAARRASVPLGSFGEVDDVASAAIFFASDQSRWVTGSVMPVDGGLSQLGGLC